MDLPRSETRLASATGAHMVRGANNVVATRLINLIHRHRLQVCVLSLNSSNYPYNKGGTTAPIIYLVQTSSDCAF